MDNVNREEAAKALGLAKAALAKRDWARALKLALTSNRLYATEEAARVAHAAARSLKEGSPASTSDEQQQQRGSSSSKASAPQSASSGSGVRVPADATYTADHVRHVRRVEVCTTFYEILGVERTVSADELKKAYRKASLRVHPDKNPAPGSVAAFQRVTDAYETLSDERKKQIYDQLGHERFTEHAKGVTPGGPAGSGGPRGGGFGFRAGDPMDADDLIRMFFQQAARGRQQQYEQRQYRAQPRRPMTPEERAYEQRRQWLSILPFALLLFFWIFSGYMAESPAFSMAPSRSYHIERVVSVGGMSFRYWVEGDFRKRFPTDEGIARVERDVLIGYATKYEQQCSYDKRRVASQQMWASRARYDELERERIALPSCATFNVLRAALVG